MEDKEYRYFEHLDIYYAWISLDDITVSSCFLWKFIYRNICCSPYQYRMCMILPSVTFIALYMHLYDQNNKFDLL